MKLIFGPVSQRPRSAWAIGTLMLVSAIPGMAQTPVINEGGVVSSASLIPGDFPGGAVVPGGLITIFGRNLGPAAGVSATIYPLQTRLANTDVMINDNQSCYPLYVSSTQVNCQLPANLTGDQILLRLRTQDQDQTRLSAPISVPLAGANFSAFARNGNGRGPGFAYNQSNDTQLGYQNNGTTSPVRPGQGMLLYGTGLGATNPPSPDAQFAGVWSSEEQPQIFVGGIQAQVRYAGRAQGYVGMDVIDFVVPPNTPTGCSVPLRIRILDRLHNQTVNSNITTIAVAATGTRCIDAVEGISQGSHGSVVLASGLGHFGPGQAGGLQGNNGPGPGGPGGPGGQGVAAQNRLGESPTVPPHSYGLGVGTVVDPATLPDVVTARFVSFGGWADIGVPPTGSADCITYFQGPRANPELFLGAASFLDAGVLTLDTPQSTINVYPQVVSGSGALYVSPLPESLGFGNYKVTGAGGVDVGSFGPVSLDVPTLINVTTSLAVGTVVDKSNSLDLSWTGGDASDLVLIHGRSYRLGSGVQGPVNDPSEYRSMAFVCTTSAGGGSFSIPATVLQTLPDGQMSISVTHMPSADGVSRFDASGLDLGGVFRWLSATTYQGLLLQ